MRASHELVNDYELLPIGIYLMLYELQVNPQKGEEYLARILAEGHHTPKYNKDGKLVEIEFTNVDVDDNAPMCPKCGRPANWVEQYKRWYCYDCKEYL